MNYSRHGGIGDLKPDRVFGCSIDSIRNWKDYAIGQVLLATNISEMRRVGEDPLWYKVINHC